MKPIESISDLAPLENKQWSYYEEQGIEYPRCDLHTMMRLYWGYTDESSTEFFSKDHGPFVTHIMPDGTFTHNNLLVMKDDTPQKIPEKVRLAILSISSKGMTGELLLPEGGYQKLQIQVEEQIPLSYQAYKLYYLPIDYSKVTQTLQDRHIRLSHVCEVCQVGEEGNAALLVANIWFIPTLEDMFGCGIEKWTGSGVSPEDFLAVAVQVVTRGHEIAQIWFWISARQFDLLEELESKIEESPTTLN